MGFEPAGNKKARDAMRRIRDDENWRKLKNEVRLASDDPSASGIGRRRLQLIECPSFEASRVWEVRESETWRLFQSRVVSPWPSVKLVGYDEVQIESQLLPAYFARVTSLSLPLLPFRCNTSGCDGTVYQLAVFGDEFSEWRFQWWSESPPQWKPLVEIANEMLTIFSTASRSNTLNDK